MWSLIDLRINTWSLNLSNPCKGMTTRGGIKLLNLIRRYFFVPEMHNTKVRTSWNFNTTFQNSLVWNYNSFMLLFVQKAIKDEDKNFLVLNTFVTIFNSSICFYKWKKQRLSESYFEVKNKMSSFNTTLFWRIYILGWKVSE